MRNKCLVSTQTSKEKIMRKLAIGAMAAIVAVLSISTSADAAMWRGRGFHGGWHHGWHHGWRGGWHHGWRGGWHHGWRGGYWGPGVVIAPGWGAYYGGYDNGYYGDYCYVRKVRHYDRYGHAYIRRVRVCE
jgi:hypothetical protein